MEINKKGWNMKTKDLESLETKDMQNTELISFLRSGRIQVSLNTRSERNFTMPKKEKRKKGQSTILSKVSPSKTLLNLVKTNEALRSTIKKPLKQKHMNVAVIHKIETNKGDCAHFCQTFKQHIDMFNKFSNAERFGSHLKKKLTHDPSVHHRLIDVLKKHAFHNINLLNDLKNI